MHNPAWDEYSKLLEGTTIADMEFNAKRFGLCRKYAFTIPTPETLKFLKPMRRFKWLDPLCGTGYWAYILRQMGIDVHASDYATIDKNFYHRPDPHMTPKFYVDDVEIIDAVESVRKHNERELILSWPPYDTPIGAEIVKNFTGTQILFIGEPWRSSCGDDELWDILQDWNVVHDDQLNLWLAIHDNVIRFEKVMF